MSLEKARELLGEFAIELDDEALTDFITQCMRIVSIIADFAEMEATI